MSALRRNAIFIVLIWAAVLIVFPDYSNAFFHDDYKHIEFIYGLADKPWRIYRVFSPFWIGWYYRPVQHVLMLGNSLAFGTGAFGYYVTSMGFHVLNIALLYRFARQWSAISHGALLAPLVFSIHSVHLDAVGWISSASIVLAATFSLIALICYTRYLDGRQAVWLALTGGALLAALLSREESLLLLPFMLIVRALRAGREPLKRVERAWLSLLLIALIAYVYFQMVRPTWTPAVGGDVVSTWLQNIEELGFLRYVFSVVEGYTRLELGEAPLIGALILLVGMAWAWFARPIVRLGILWTALYLGFVYLLVWSRDATMFAPRYLYLPFLGLSLAVGSTIVAVASSKYRTRKVYDGEFGLILIAVLLVTHQIPEIQMIQEQRRNHTEAVLEEKKQLMAIVPQPNSNTRFFAYDWLPGSDFIQAMATVWYDRSFAAPGGGLPRLKSAGQADADTYLLNYTGGAVINLMPELQKGETAIFIWNQQPLPQRWEVGQTPRPLEADHYALERVVGPPNAQRFGFMLGAPASGWASIAYTVQVPANSTLRFAVFNELAGSVEGNVMTFRVRTGRPSGRLETLFSQAVTAREREWIEASIPMTEYWEETVVLHFEVKAGGNAGRDRGHWANPRFITAE